MIFKITHQIEYYYDQAVFLEPHILNLVPHPVQQQEVVSFHCDIAPCPEGMTQNVNEAGFKNKLVWFDHTVNRFSVESNMIVKFVEFNPFAFFIHPIQAVDLPMSYCQEVGVLLRPYCEPTTQKWMVKAKAEDLSKKAGSHTVSFLTQTCQWIHDEFKYQAREEGEPYSSEQTLAAMKGSCRDLAVLFMDLCRHRGLAARFVSGYFVDEREKLELHAWVDIYIPGAGWRGFDPTHGIACFGKHLALTASYDPRLCAPVIGSFRGQGRAIMKTNLSLAPHQVD